MYPVVLSIHVLICLMVVLVVLIQSGKGAGFSGLFGGGSSDALFNAPSGSMFLRKLTTVLAAGFFTTCLLLTYLATKQHGMSVTQPFSVPMNAAPMPEAPAPAEAPAAPAKPAEQKAVPAKPAPAAPKTAPAPAKAAPASEAPAKKK